LHRRHDAHVELGIPRHLLPELLARDLAVAEAGGRLAAVTEADHGVELLQQLAHAALGLAELLELLLLALGVEDRWARLHRIEREAVARLDLDVGARPARGARRGARVAATGGRGDPQRERLEELVAEDRLVGARHRRPQQVVDDVGRDARRDGAVEVGDLALQHLAQLELLQVRGALGVEALEQRVDGALELGVGDRVEHQATLSSGGWSPTTFDGRRFVCTVASPSATARSMSPSASPSATGTALPICLYLSEVVPENCQSSGNPCTRAYSRTESGRSSVGWASIVAFWIGEVTRVGEGSRRESRRKKPTLPPPDFHAPPIACSATSAGSERQLPPSGTSLSTSSTRGLNCTNSGSASSMPSIASPSVRRR